MTLPPVNTVQHTEGLTAEDRLRLHVHDPLTFAFVLDDAEQLVAEIDALRASPSSPVSRESVIDPVMHAARRLAEAWELPGWELGEDSADEAEFIQRMQNLVEAMRDGGHMERANPAGEAEGGS